MWGRQDRFIEPFSEVPGPGAHSIIRPKTTTGRMGTSRLESSLAPRNAFPGPCSYVQEENLSKRVRGVGKFQAGGKRDPFGPIPPTPGPNSYKIKHEYVPLRLKKMRSGAFASTSKRDSFIGKVPDGPGIGKYSVPTGNTWELPQNFHELRPKGFHTFGARTSRYVYVGNLKHAAAVPGPGAYELPAFGARPRTTSEMNNNSNARPRLLGKQFETGVKVPTFGADRGSRDTWAGRLDLAKLYPPGPNAYDVVAAMAHLESQDAAGASSRPSSPLHSRSSSPCTFGAGENRHTYAGDLLYHSQIPGPGQYSLPGIGK